MSGMPQEAPAVLQFDGARLRWPGATEDLLHIERLRLGAHERLMLQGCSGSGKSTLLSLAAGVLLPRAGEVRLLGQAWGALPAGARDRRRADHVGYIFQQFNLLPYLSVLDNVLLACRFSALRASRCEQGSPQAAARRLLEALGMPAALWRRPARALSVGQQQRVAAARALIGRPALVIADEPTSALDEAQRDAFMTLLMHECAAAGSALLFVSHDTRLRAHFDRVVPLAEVNAARAPQEAAP